PTPRQRSRARPVTVSSSLRPPAEGPTAGTASTSMNRQRSFRKWRPVSPKTSHCWALGLYSANLAIQNLKCCSASPPPARTPAPYRHTPEILNHHSLQLPTYHFAPVMEATSNNFAP